ncbi:MAG TPA: rhodanese-like domain-containing protein [Methylophaga aminisulfidivorans]|uniref:Rhodanese-like domain-containing protein n=1 Tax=Methylophaga thalassica TaxID=40223 RepID=A0ABQ5TWY8_9GAMM|nr:MULTISPECIES: rhodanese-like domain-containing protein [Methylophaga]GLQ00055.1 rhodanese-like domain-containing protein [Methylophaga thalassica]HIC46723.1 rhodanese-like domain-containing protein [Methylophaga sp.]HIM39444.1 rhodanese-like domain-containing protein [Methylophaga aminisulfidivorans]
MKQMTATEFSTLLLSEAPPVMIDVRESHELVHGMIEGAMHIPMNEIPARLEELGPYQNKTVAIICRSGKRSAQVGQFLEHVGFNDVINLDGGMNGWAVNVDTTMSTY